MNFLEFAQPVEQHNRLNPILWDNHRLRPEISLALVRIARDFKQFIDVPFKVLDIQITGGNANFTYTAHSDIDLHLIADFDSVSCDREAAELFDSKRLLYKREYHINLRGIPVEVYVEDHRHPAVSAGAYSLVKDSWVRQPNADVPDYDHEQVEKWVDTWHTVIKTATKTGNLQTCRTALKMLRHYRKLGLRTPEGEFSVPNLVYKSLRNDETVKGIQTLIDQLHGQDLSLDQE
jgi:hypothetical protein